jgi:hypothetical protein
MANYMAMIWRNCLERGSQELVNALLDIKIRFVFSQAGCKDQIIRVED